MMEATAEPRQRLKSVDIRILSAKKRSSYRTARIQNFPVAESCEDFRSQIQNSLPGERCVANFDFGYIDENKKKLWVNSDTELEDAYAAALGGNPLWIEPDHATV